MKQTRSGAVVVTVIAGLGLAACFSNAPMAERSLKPFTDQRSIDEFIHKAEVWRAPPVSRGFSCSDDEGPCLEEIVVHAGKNCGASVALITNIQEAGVDEGDIVKRVGDYILMLRRGRLFSFSLPQSGGAIAAHHYIDVDNAQDTLDAWYDEILSHDDIVILLGYSDELDASLIHRFRVDGDGTISRDGSWYLRSHDYYDIYNYSTRLVDGQLVFYMPRPLLGGGPEVVSGRLIDGRPADEQSVFSSEVIYQPLQQSDDPIAHTIAVCPIESEDLRCRGTSIVGPWEAMTYVSRDAAYLWILSYGWAYDLLRMNDSEIEEFASKWSASQPDYEDTAAVYRIPLDGSSPGFVEVDGEPLNQLSFRENGGSLDVLAGDYDETVDNWVPKLVDIPLAAFHDDYKKLADRHYRVLPRLTGELRSNRYIGDWLFYAEAFWDDREDLVTSDLLAVNLGDPMPPVRLSLQHDAERIEAVANTAVVIGDDRQPRLGLSVVDTSTALVAQTTWIDDAWQAGRRSHAFNYTLKDDEDIVAFPIELGEDVERSMADGSDDSIPVYVRFYALDKSTRAATPLGELSGIPANEDACKVSCEDWYGGARPFFIDDRVYALIGYELVEGHVSGARVHESSRVDGLSLLPKYLFMKSKQE